MVDPASSAAAPSDASSASPDAIPPPLPARIPKSYDEPRVRREFWPKLKRVIARVPGLADVLALWYYLNSDLAPLKHKVSILATLAYFILPIDAIPDVLGPLGYTDDIAVALGLIRFIGSEVMLPYRRYARLWLKGQAPTDLDPTLLATLAQPRPKTKKGRNSRGEFIDVQAIDVRRET